MASSLPPPTALGRFGFTRLSAVELLIALVLLIVTTPFVEDLPQGDFIEVCLTSLVLVLAVLAVGAKRMTLLIATLLVIPAVITKWLNHIRPGLFPTWVYLVSALIFVSFVVVSLLRYIPRAPKVTGEVICACISAYLLLGLLWAFAYMLTANATPDAFSFNTTHPENQTMDGPTALYFSFVTLSTVGYGDITPSSQVARMLAMTEAMTGLLYVAVLLARLVALYSTPEPVAVGDASDRSPTE
jgi:hypothetical protein